MVKNRDVTVFWPAGALLPEGYIWDGFLREEDGEQKQDIVRISDMKRVVAVLDPTLGLDEVPDLEETMKLVGRR